MQQTWEAVAGVAEAVEAAKAEAALRPAEVAAEVAALRPAADAAADAAADSAPEGYLILKAPSQAARTMTRLLILT